MRLRIYAVALTSVIVLLVYFLFNSSQAWAALAMPGFFVAVLINGSLHDRLIPGFLAIGVFFNCVFYSAVVLFAIWLFDKTR
jgi:hypothetical protein